MKGRRVKLYRRDAAGGVSINPSLRSSRQPVVVAAELNAFPTTCCEFLCALGKFIRVTFGFPCSSSNAGTLHVFISAPLLVGFIFFLGAPVLFATWGESASCKQPLSVHFNGVLVRSGGNGIALVRPNKVKETLRRSKCRKAMGVYLPIVVG